MSLNLKYLFAGPCMAESKELCLEVADFLKSETKDLETNFVFKSSFDKANRSDLASFRGPGIDKGLSFLNSVKAKYQLPLITDFHIPAQASEISSVCDWVQVPAFLCRQTDMLVAAAETGKDILVKKGQFLGPGQIASMVQKCHLKPDQQLAIGERGSFFGYGDLVVDFRNFHYIAEAGALSVFDLSHSLQNPGGGQTGGNKDSWKLLLKAALGAGIDGLFVEVHPDPENAFSDKKTQFTFSEFKELIQLLKSI